MSTNDKPDETLLPADGLVYHYHPVAFLEYLRSQLAEDKQAAAPGTALTSLDGVRFFIEEDGTRTYVQTPGEVEAALGAWKRGVTVQAELDGATEPVGRTAGSTYKGLASYRGDGIYDVLLGDSTLDGIPELSDLEKRVWSSLNDIEGSLFGVNSWDDQYLSCGPFQQTMGSGETGELPAAFWYTKQFPESKRIFDAYLGNAGFDVEGKKEYTRKPVAEAVYEDKVLHGASKKMFRAFEWGYRFQKAMEHTEFRYRFMQQGFARLSYTIGNTTLAIRPKLIDKKRSSLTEETLKLVDIFKTDLALAILLSIHIHMPGYVTSEFDDSRYRDEHIWLHGMIEAYATENPRFEDVSDMTVEDEYWLIEKMIETAFAADGRYRNRLAKTIVYASYDALNTFAEKLGYDDWGAFDDHHSLGRPKAEVERMPDVLNLERGDALEVQSKWLAEDEAEPVPA